MSLIWHNVVYNPDIHNIYHTGCKYFMEDLGFGSYTFLLNQLTWQKYMTGHYLALQNEHLFTLIHCTLFLLTSALSFNTKIGFIQTYLEADSPTKVTKCQQIPKLELIISQFMFIYSQTLMWQTWRELHKYFKLPKVRLEMKKVYVGTMLLLWVSVSLTHQSLT